MEYTNQTPESVVYMYNWKNLIYVLRTKDGKWHYTSNLYNIVEHANKTAKYQFRYQSQKDMFEVGRMFGMCLEELVEKCKLSYGDKSDD